MKRKRIFFRLRPVMVVCICIALLLTLTACAQNAVQYETQPGITYAQLIRDMNRQVVSGLTTALPRVLWWGKAGDHVIAYGSNENDPIAPCPHLLADIDPENETFTTIPLTLPVVPDSVPGVADALEVQQAAAAAGVTLQRDAAQGYDVPMRAVTAVLEAENGQLYLLLSDTLRHFQQDATGGLTAAVTERAITLCNLSADGALQPITQLQIPSEYLLLEHVAQDCLLGPDNTLWISATDFYAGQAYLLRFSLTDGRLLSSLSLPKGTAFQKGGLIQLQDDRLLVLTAQIDAETSMAYADTAQFYIAENIASDKPTWQDPVSLSDTLRIDAATGFVPPLDCDMPTGDPLVYNAEGIYRVSLETGEAEQQLDWIDFAVQPIQLSAAFAMSEGRYLVAVSSNGQSDNRVQVLTPLDPAVVANRKVLTFGKINFSGSVVSDPIQEVIARFNASSDEYYIQTIDYEKMAEMRGLGWGNGEHLLKEDLLRQEAPDIMMLGTTTVSSALLRKGMMIDLYPYIDEDPVLSRTDFLVNILSLSRIDDTLPTIMASYTIETLVGSNTVLGEDMGWSWQDYQALCKAVDNPAPVFRTSRQDFLLQLVRRAGDTFVNRTTGQAHFTSPDFVALLESSAAYPAQIDVNEEHDPKSLLNSETLLVDCWLSSWSDLADSVYLFNDNYVYKGYPSDGSNTGSTIIGQLQLGISSQCAYPDAAWQLLRNFLLPEFQDKLGSNMVVYPGFPLRQDSLAVSARNGSAQLSAGTVPSYLRWGSSPIADIQVQASQSDIDKVIQLIEQATVSNNFDQSVANIITEEAEAYYNGQRTAEETAKIIQNRVQTYLDEQG